MTQTGCLSRFSRANAKVLLVEPVFIVGAEIAHKLTTVFWFIKYNLKLMKGEYI